MQKMAKRNLSAEALSSSTYTYAEFDAHTRTAGAPTEKQVNGQFPSLHVRVSMLLAEKVKCGASNLNVAANGGKSSALCAGEALLHIPRIPV